MRLCSSVGFAPGLALARSARSFCALCLRASSACFPSVPPTRLVVLKPLNNLYNFTEGRSMTRQIETGAQGDGVQELRDRDAEKCE